MNPCARPYCAEAAGCAAGLEPAACPHRAAAQHLDVMEMPELVALAVEQLSLVVVGANRPGARRRRRRRRRLRRV